MDVDARPATLLLPSTYNIGHCWYSGSGLNMSQRIRGIEIGYTFEFNSIYADTGHLLSGRQCCTQRGGEFYLCDSPGNDR